MNFFIHPSGTIVRKMREIGRNYVNARMRFANTFCDTEQPKMDGASS